MKGKSFKFALMTIEEARLHLMEQLEPVYSNRESASIADWIMERITGLKKIDRIINKTLPLLPEQLARLEHYGGELRTHKPVQYVLHEAWFMSRKFYVNDQVLIPRPETEELVRWIIEDVSSSTKGNPVIADIGTGSGCIAISLKAAIPGSEIYAVDISADALEVAKENAAAADTSVQLIQCDFLDASERKALPAADILVSNPPYVPLSDRAGMEKNVVDFEPSIALFVTDDDPYIFYRTLAAHGKEKLKENGSIYAELHESGAATVGEIFRRAGFPQIIVRKDMQGKERLIRAHR